MNLKTTEMSQEEWLESRRKGIGGSDVAAILGLSKYKTPLDIYNEKINGHKTEINAAMKAGLMLENTVADWYVQETGRKILRDNKIRIHKDYPFLIANLDRIILPVNGEGRGILEIKTAGTYSAKNWADEPPVEYILQLQHYLDVTGYTWGEFAVLVGGIDFKRYFVQRSEEIIKLKNEKLLDFWANHILTKTPPEPVNSGDIEKIYTDITNGKTVEASQQVIDVLVNLKKTKEQIKDLEKYVENGEEQIKLLMKDADTLVFGEDTVCTWKQSMFSSFDTKRFKAEHPELYTMYTNQKESRRFTIKI